MTDEQDQSFAARLKSLREAAELTQTQLADRAGMHKLGVAKLEQGLREPTWATVRALARALGVSVAAFEDGEESGKASRPVKTAAASPAGRTDSKPTPGLSAEKKPAKGQGRKRKEG